MVLHQDDYFTIMDVCQFLTLSDTEVLRLSQIGLLATVVIDNQTRYPQKQLLITQQLLRIGEQHNWSTEVLATYADLVFAAGAIATLWTHPPVHYETQDHWINLSTCVEILGNFYDAANGEDEMFNTLLCCIVELGQNSYWPDDWTKSPFHTLALDIEKKHNLVLHNQTKILLQRGAAFLAGLVHTFKFIAIPCSPDLFTFLAKMELPYFASLPQDSTQNLGNDPIFYPMFQRSRSIEFPLSEVNLTIEKIISHCKKTIGTTAAKFLQDLYDIAQRFTYWGTPILRVNLTQCTKHLDGEESSSLLAEILIALSRIEIISRTQRWEAQNELSLHTFRPIRLEAFHYEEDALPEDNNLIKHMEYADIVMDIYAAVRRTPSILWIDLESEFSTFLD